MLREISGAKGVETTGDWRKTAKCDTSDLCHSSDIICVIKLKKWAAHVARRWRRRAMHRVFVGKPEGKKDLARTCHTPHQIYP